MTKTTETTSATDVAVYIEACLDVATDPEHERNIIGTEIRDVVVEYDGSMAIHFANGSVAFVRIEIEESAS